VAGVAVIAQQKAGDPKAAGEGTASLSRFVFL
jgi:hypothetical protein